MAVLPNANDNAKYRCAQHGGRDHLVQRRIALVVYFCGRRVLEAVVSKEMLTEKEIPSR